jgi:hypothetical protein
MRRTFILLFGLIILAHTGCTRSNEYHSLIERELATKVRNDTLLMDIRFGMKKRNFFAHCWELNKKGILAEGINNASVHFEFIRFDKEYEVDFYPIFYEGKIFELPVKYKYTAFAPWNPKYSTDTLLLEILNIHKEKYGNDFIEIRSKNQDIGTAYVRVDGNRRISIYKNIHTNSITVLYFDLLSKKKDSLID